MDPIEKATQSQIANLQQRSGKTLEELFGIIRESGLSKHGQIRDMLKTTLGMGHGDANTLTHLYLAQAAPAAAPQSGAEDPLDAIYTGTKAALRPIHEALMAQIAQFGPFDVAPKKANVSLRRRRQFAMLGPGTRGRFEVGLNIAALEGSERLVAQSPGGMCQYKVFLTSPDEADAELVGWLRAAYEAAG
ncbi:MAG: DUF4287 domain-containing protein [Chloroflexi bacterium]|nr:DUF4287 domain-containing protein [Chloroflexota bacterium]